MAIAENEANIKNLQGDLENAEESDKEDIKNKIEKLKSEVDFRKKMLQTVKYVMEKRKVNEGTVEQVSEDVIAPVITPQENQQSTNVSEQEPTQEPQIETIEGGVPTTLSPIFKITLGEIKDMATNDLKINSVVNNGTLYITFESTFDSGRTKNYKVYEQTASLSSEIATIRGARVNLNLTPEDKVTLISISYNNKIMTVLYTINGEQRTKSYEVSDEMLSTFEKAIIDANQQSQVEQKPELDPSVQEGIEDQIKELEAARNRDADMVIAKMKETKNFKEGKPISEKQKQSLLNALSSLYVDKNDFFLKKYPKRF